MSQERKKEQMAMWYVIPAMEYVVEERVKRTLSCGEYVQF
jgi:hypothetical protein